MPQFTFLFDEDIDSLPSTTWLVEDVFPDEGFAAIFGESRAGKSFLALDLACCIARGDSWFNRRVEPAPVLYIALEGESGFQKRMQAWRKHNNCKLPIAAMLRHPFYLTTEEDVITLATKVLSEPRLGSRTVVFIDTLNRTAPDADENSSQGMGAIIAGAKKLQELLGGLVVLVHHTGKDLTRGLRGHSSLLAALDASIEVQREGQARKWIVDKSKEGSDGDEYPFELQVVELGVDEYDKPITSCVIKPAGKWLKTSSLTPSGPNQCVAFSTLQALFKESPKVKLELAIYHVTRELLHIETKHRTERARKAIHGLIRKGLIQEHEGVLTLPSN